MKTNLNLNKSKLALLLFLPTIGYGYTGKSKIPSTVAVEKQGAQKVVFTENKGQVHDQNYVSRPDVLFAGTDGNLVYHLKNNGISYQLRHIDSWKKVKNPRNRMQPERSVPNQTTIYRLDINWLNAKTNPAVVKGEQLPGFSNHYLTNCGDGALNVKSYETVTYQNIYSGINLKWYQKDGHLKYDYEVSANSDYKKIQLEIKGADNIRLNSAGELVIKTPLGEIIEQAPLVTQSGKTLKSKWIVNQSSEGAYVLTFGIENLDATHAFVIDPAVRVWGTFYGGGGDESGSSCATDASGNVYMSGYTDSNSGTDIATVGSHQATMQGTSYDAFLVKFNSAGVRQWGTYYGGSGDDQGTSCATDASGNVYLAGYSDSNTGTDIATLGSHQATNGGGTYDAFLVKFNGSGVRQWGTYYGDAGDDEAYSCAVDASGDIYISGTTDSNTGTAIATLGSHQATFGGGFTDGFLAKFNAAGVRQWGTYYGGTGDEMALCAANSAGDIFLSGYSDSNVGTVIATAASHQPVNGGSIDGFVAKFNAAGVRQWGTYYGGAGDDYGYSSSIDATGNIYFAGYTDSNTGTSIATGGGFQPAFGGGNADDFLVKFNAAGVRQWGTYYGGGGDESGAVCATDASGNVYMSGMTDSGTGIATAGSQQTSFAGFIDGFFVKFDGAGARQWGTYYGGSQIDVGIYCAADALGNVYLCGVTDDTGSAIATVGSHQSTNGGGFIDAFLVKFLAGCSNLPAMPTAISGLTVTCPGAGSYSVSPVAGATSYVWTLPVGWSGSSTTNSINVTMGLSGTLSVAATNSCGSSADQTVAVMMSPSVAPPAAILGATLLCAGSAIYSVNPVAGATSYSWNLPSGWTGSSTSNTINATTGSSGTFSVASSNSCGVTSPTTLSVTVNALPELTVSATRSVICKGESTNLMVSGANSYSWSPNGTGTNAAVSPTATVIYTVTGTGANSCSNKAMVTVTVNGCTGVWEASKVLFSVRVFPNPSEGDFSISVSSVSENTQLEIYNSIGQIVLTKKMESTETKVDLNQQPSGVYFARIKENNAVVSTSRLIIQ